MENNYDVWQFFVYLFLIDFRISNQSSVVMFFQTTAVRPTKSTAAAQHEPADFSPEPSTAKIAPFPCAVKYQNSSKSHLFRGLKNILFYGDIMSPFCLRRC
jgi:hypothetical protein